MKVIKKELFIGFTVSIFATGCGIFLYLEYISAYGLKETIQMVKDGNLYAQVVSLAALPNLFVFFVFIKKKQDDRAKGVLMGCMLTAFFTFALNFFTN